MQYMTQRKRNMANADQQQAAGEHLAGFVRTGARKGGNYLWNLFGLEQFFRTITKPPF